MKRAVIDIETVPLVPTSELSPDELRKASLNALAARVACIGWITLDQQSPVESVALVGGMERALLQRFWESMTQSKVASFVAHNGLGFDLPFLWRRSVVNGVRPPVKLDLRKYRTDFVFDTMQVWANWDTRSYVSLAELAHGLEVGEKNASGEDVASLWELGFYENIATYCLNDCWLTYRLFARMNFFEPQSIDVPTHVEVLTNGVLNGPEPASILTDTVA